MKDRKETSANKYESDQLSCYAKSTDGCLSAALHIDNLKKNVMTNGENNSGKQSSSLKACPFDNASLLSKYVGFFWIYPLVKIGFVRNLEEDDLFGNAKENDSTDLGAQLLNNWSREIELAKQQNRKPSLFRVLFRQYIFSWLILCTLLFLSLCVGPILRAIVLGQLIEDVTNYNTIRTVTQHVDNGDELEVTMEALYWRIFLMGLLVIAATLSTFLTSGPYCFYCRYIGMKMRVASCSLIFQKSIRLNAVARSNTTVGQIINLISNDVSKFDYGLIHLSFLLMAPLQSIIMIALISHLYLGLVPTLAGFSLILIYLPFQAIMGNRFGVIREKTAEHTDERIRLMAEIISAMRVIKMYAWEKSFAKLVDEARKREISWIRYRAILSSINEAVYLISGKSIMLACLIASIFIVSNDNQLTPEAIFVTMALIDSYRLTMTYFFPTGVAYISEIMVTCDRLQVSTERSIERCIV